MGATGKIPEAGGGPQVATLVELFDRAAAAGQPDLLNYKRDGRWHHLAAREVADRVRLAALGLFALGVGPGARVGLLSENRPEWTIADLAVLCCGAADVPVYATQSPGQVGYILRDAAVEVMFISGRAQYERVREALDSAPALRVIVSFDPVGTGDERVLGFDELLRRGREAGADLAARYEETRRAVSAEQLATLIYTSGTTGEPKGVMLTHRNLVSNVLANRATLALAPGEVALSFLPLSHIFERTALYVYLSLGVAVYYAESVEAVAANLAEVRPHCMTSVPRLFEKIYAKTMERAEAGGKARTAVARWAVGTAKEWAEVASRGGRPGAWLDLKRRVAMRLVFAKWREAVGGRIRYFVSGGAPLETELAQVFYGAGLPILQGYGLTESSPVITSNTPGANRLGSVGRPIPGVSVRLAADGEILCAGPNVMLGYYGKPEATAEALELDAEGRLWLHTGDIGRFDEDGFLYITDRKKDLLKTSGGKYIAPQPIENLIKRSRFVNQVVVIGDQRKFPAALIVPQLDALESYAALKGIAYREPAELLGHPRIIDLIERQVEKQTAELAHFEKIKAVALLDRELTIEGGELTPTLKVKRRAVAEKYKQLIDRLYAEREEKYAVRQ